MIPVVSFPTDLLSCVDPNVVEAFLSRGDRSTYEITDTLPEKLSTLEFSDRTSLIGTLETVSYTSTAFSTDSAPRDAMDTMEATLQNEGWIPVENTHTEPREKGFQERQLSTRQQISYCLPDNSAMMLSSRERSNDTILYLTDHTSSQNNFCGLDSFVDPFRDMGFTSGLMPVLYLPDNANQRGSGYGGMIRTSGDDAYSHVRLKSQLSRENILEYFSTQLLDQGWVNDSTWFGGATIGSTWTFDKQGLPSTAATLVLLEHSEGDYTARFSMVAL